MAVFDLYWLRGPGSSTDENFEILSLELLKAEFPQGQYHRVGAPDQGIDILGYEGDPHPKIITVGRGVPDEALLVAYQCKAYSRFTSSFVRAVRQSMETAIKARSSSSSLNWQQYCLITPLLLTARQRGELYELWKYHELTPDIKDIDYLEQLLYKHEHVRIRFFPDFLILIPEKHTPIQIGFPEFSKTVDIVLHIHRYAQDIPLRIPSGITIHGVIQILIDKLSLPTQAIVHTISTNNFTIDWNLYLAQEHQKPLDKSKTLEQLQIANNSQVELKYELNIKAIINYFGGGRSPYYCKVYDRENGWIEMSRPDRELIHDRIEIRVRELFPQS